MTDIPMKVERKPDCAVCGQPYYRHNVGAVTTCPIIATYRPPTANPLPEEVEIEIRNIVGFGDMGDRVIVALERLSTDRPGASVTESRSKLTAEYLAMSPLQKWETLTVNGLLGTDEPWIADMRETLRGLSTDRDSVKIDGEATLRQTGLTGHQAMHLLHTLGLHRLADQFSESAIRARRAV